MPDLTEKDVEQTKRTTASTPDVDLQDKRISKVHVSQTPIEQWTVELEYQDKDGKTIDGETQTFDEFSQASSWVAGIEVETNNDTGMQAPSIDDTTKL